MYLPLRLSAAILAGGLVGALARRSAGESTEAGSSRGLLFAAGLVTGEALMGILRSEEHTSELQSRLHLVCRLLLEKKKTMRVARPSPSCLVWSIGMNKAASAPPSPAELLFGDVATGSRRRWAIAASARASAALSCS